ncbi:granule-bound starch synthase 1, chloroplastic/amyloplastic-like isoform X1 [Carex rostrata]
MEALTASQFISNCACAKPEHESRFLGKTQIVACPGLRPGNSVELLQVRSCAMNPTLKTTRHSVGNEKTENIMRMQQGMKIVFVSAEMAPWSKTGGLGDVLGGLPPAMAANGHRVMVVSPRHDQYSDAWDTSVLAEFKVGNKNETVRFFHCYKRGVDRVFVDHPMFLEKVWGKTGSKIYGPIAGTDYEDNQLRFSLLCLAALEAPRILNLSNQNFSGPYGEDVAFVCNDWHTAALPCYLKSMYQPHGIYANAKVAFCIHNIAYQGRYAFDDFSLLNLPDSFKRSFEFYDEYEVSCFGLKINWMKAGIMECDLLLTVSPYYAEELRSAAGLGLDQYILSKQPSIKGIVNGMDINEWNPLIDKFIAINYDATTVNEAKPLNKEALQAETGLPVDRSIPLIAFIGRLEEQKGSDILAAALPELMEDNIQVVILGTGKKKLQRELEAIEAMYPNKVRAVTNFSAALAHQMLAGADFLVMPSRFEPCGLIQLQGMRYGTPVVVSSTGGLVDTIVEGRTGFHMGRFSAKFEVVDPADVSKVVTTLKRTINVIGTAVHKEMIQNCMAQDLSWKGPAKEWESTLLSLGVEGSKAGIDGEETAPLAKENVAAP